MLTVQRGAASPSADDVTAAVQRRLAGSLDAAEHNRLIDNALKKVVIQ